jgi:hypothetical protein
MLASSVAEITMSPPDVSAPIASDIPVRRPSTNARVSLFTRLLASTSEAPTESPVAEASAATSDAFVVKALTLITSSAVTVTSAAD